MIPVDVAAQKAEKKEKNADDINQEVHIDLWKNKLYLLENGKKVLELNIAPGKEDKPTPVGHFKIVNKSRNWGSGFGTRWMGLNVPWGKYGIHGTNKPWLIGQNVSSGCVRMRNPDVEKLYNRVRVGTPVYIDGPIMGSSRLTYRILVQGSRGSLVQLVQNRLKAAGYYKGPAHGIFDRYTELSVIAWQKKNNLEVTGQIGYHDYIALGIIE
ncbi:MAG: L,D-transpeptidase family protein [Bacillaceae bacterium]|nr:L,D-transpeptidase family protein [Bacillaceae bacterium]